MLAILMLGRRHKQDAQELKATLSILGHAPCNLGCRNSVSKHTHKNDSHKSFKRKTLNEEEGNDVPFKHAVTFLLYRLLYTEVCT